MLQMLVALRLFLRRLMIKWQICRNFVDAAQRGGDAHRFLYLCGGFVIFMRDAPAMWLLYWQNSDILLIR